MKTLGLDCSHHNGSFNWAKAKQQGYSFGFAKATEGLNFIDNQMNRNHNEAIKNGILFGYYHFFRPGVDPLAQAHHYLKVTGSHIGLLPPVLDWEASDNVRTGVQIQSALTWLNEVEAGSKRIPIIYGSPGFLDPLHLPDSFARYPLWVAHYGVSHPRIPHPWNKYAIWQTSDKNGLDIDQSPLSLEELKHL